MSPFYGKYIVVDNSFIAFGWIWGKVIYALYIFKSQIQLILDAENATITSYLFGVMTHGR